MASMAPRKSDLHSTLFVIILSHLVGFGLASLRETSREDAKSDLSARLLPGRIANAHGQSPFVGNLTFPTSALQATSPASVNSNGSLATLLGRADSLRGQQNSSTISERVLQIQVTAIHVDRSEFPLGKLLFKLTLRLALSEASRMLDQQEPRATQLQDRAAQQQASSRQRLPRVKLKLSVRSANTCSHQYAAALAAEEFYVRRSRLFVVSGCDDAIRSVSRLASQWRVPVMTAAGFGADLNDKTVHRTLIRVAFSLRAAVEFLFKIIRSFQWRRVNLIVDESDANSQALRGSIEQHVAKMTAQSAGGEQFKVGLNTVALDLQALSRNNRAAGDGDEEFEAAMLAANSSTISDKSKVQLGEQQQEDDKWPNQLTEEVVQEALRQSSTYSRVTILLIPQQFVRRFMLSVYDQQMATGLYTFINMPLLAQEGSTSGGAEQADATSDSQSLWRSARSRRNAQAKQAFESLMSVYLRTPTTKAYVYFASKLTELANANMPSPNDTRPNQQPNSVPSTNRLLGAKSRSASPTQKRVQPNTNPYSASFYDGIQIYASALDESLRVGGLNVTDFDLHGRISELVRNRRFENMVTGNIYINSNGDRETDYTLDDMDQMTGKFAPVILYRGETRDIERVNRIHWSSDVSVGPTSDVVDCNLLGTCVSKPMTRFTLGLVLLAGPLVFILAAAFYFVHNNLTLESQLVDHWWKIHLSDVEIVLARRKNANDGSLVLQGDPAATGSLVSSQHEHSLRVAQGEGQKVSQAGGPNRRRAAVGLGRRSATGSMMSAEAAPANCDKTEVTKATDASATWASTAVDVCYGNITLAIYKLSKVALRPLPKFHQSRKLMIELRNLKEINHNNLCRFVGILVDEGSLAIVSDFCPKGSLREFFHNESMVIDWTFKYSIINDIMAGLLYLHSSSLGFHGRLKSSNCLVSARFVVKLSDYGPHSLYEQIDDDADHDSSHWLAGRLWLAPEHINAGASKMGSMRGDIYSFGLLLYEIITNSLPFFDGQREDFVMPLKALYQELKCGRASELMEPAIRSILQADDEETASAANGGPQVASIRPLVELMQACWQAEASKRPSSTAVNTALKRITRGVTPKKLLENLTGRMEQYTNNLESLVEAKLACLLEEKQRAEELLYQFVPKSIASLLKEGQFVEPEAFECVTVFYSDIVGFTSLSSESSPMEVVDFLSDLYLCFDSTLEQHDIFKVDTIGDAYIVASGLPQRNEGKHVIEIACAALELRDRLERFRIPHKPERRLEMRVGIHSGPCIAGIVGGLQMPKYCIFGDTLTTGKFMESSGLPMKIHITEQSRALLQSLPDFAIEPRQPRITRDGLPFQTYWLERAIM